MISVLNPPVARATVTLLFTAMIACGGSEPPVIDQRVTAEPAPVVELGEPNEESGTPAPVRVANTGPRLVRLPRTVLTGPAPSIEVRRPRDGQVIARGPVQVTLGISNFELAPAPGNHVHVRVDENVTIPVHDVSRPFDLSALYEEQSGEALASGTHVLRVFLARGNHESVKLPGAFAITTFSVGAATREFAIDRAVPMLTYNRPSGCASDSVRLVDFFLTNLNDLSRTGYQVRYEIDGSHTGNMLSWSPYMIQHLGTGDHTIRLSLITPDGEPAPGPYNDTTVAIRSGNECSELGLIPDDLLSEDEEVLD